MSIKKFNELPELIKTNFNAMVIRINLPRNKMRLWETFSYREKKTLGSSYQNAIKIYKTWEMWQKFHHIPEPVCLIEIGYKLGLIDLATRDEFLREINYKTKTIKAVKTLNNLKPIWKKETGELRYNDELIRKIRRTKCPTNAEAIFNAFHKARWKSTIPNPLNNKDPKILEDSIRHLRKGLSVITFSSARRGAEISWGLVDPD
jgi:hypothetical protein